jgi:hypothetical protein
VDEILYAYYFEQINAQAKTANRIYSKHKWALGGAGIVEGCHFLIRSFSSYLKLIEKIM